MGDLVDKDRDEAREIFKKHNMTSAFFDRVAAYIFGAGNNFPVKVSSRMISPADSVASLTSSTSSSRGGKQIPKFDYPEVGRPAIDQLGGLALASKFSFPQNINFIFSSLLMVAGKETEVFHMLFGFWLLVFGTPYIDPTMKTRVGFIFFQLSGGRFLLAKIQQMIKVCLTTASAPRCTWAHLASLSHALALTPS